MFYMKALSSSRPLIGITPSYSYDEKKLYVNNNCMESINEAGGLAVLLPLTNNSELLKELVKECKGFLITGGPDIDAKYYGESNFSYNGTISPLRDEMEIYIIKKAHKAKIPVLGICRGNQILNVAMGGSLYQDINSQLKEQNILKHLQSAPKWYPIHEIYIKENSIMKEIFGENIIRVNSFHHQAVKDIAPGFMVTSEAKDRVVESIEYIKKQDWFALGVQWHPEVMWVKNEIHFKIFKKFISAIKDYGKMS